MALAQAPGNAVCGASSSAKLFALMSGIIDEQPEQHEIALPWSGFIVGERVTRFIITIISSEARTSA